MEDTNSKRTSGLAVAGLVLGIIAIVTSFLPIINNLSAILAVVGGILAVIGLVGAVRGRNASKGIAIAGVVLAVVSFAVVLATQSMYAAAIDSAAESIKTGSRPVASAQAEQASANDAANQEPADQPAEQGEPAEAAEAADQPAEQGEPADAAEAADAVDYSHLAVGQAVTLEDGLTVIVNSVQSGLVNYDGSLVTCVNVTYQNGGNANSSFNPYDWKGEDANGAQRTTAFFSEATDELHSGTLSAGGTVTGNLYFDEGIVRVLYYSNMFQNEATVGWVLA